MAMNLAIAAFLLASTLFSSSASATTLTIQNLCPYPVWPLITPNDGFPVVYNNAAPVITDALLSVVLPDATWAGRVTASTGCDGAGANCGTGVAPPYTVAQIQVHGGGDADEAGYSVSLVDGFNVPMVIFPQGGVSGLGLCLALGCAVDLNRECPPDQRAAGGTACRGPPDYFKSLCPLTRTTPPDVETVPQSCRAPGELKIVLCQPTTQPSMVHGTAADRVIGTVVEGGS